MKKQNISILVAVLALLVVLVPSVGAVPRAHAQGSTGTVYIMTNDPSGNQIVVYSRSVDGSLTWITNVATNGLGLNGLTGGVQSALALSSNGKWLFAVNAGSNSVSVFQVTRNGLVLTDTASSGRARPVSVTVFGSWVYVLDNNTANVAGNIAGFSLSPNGELSPIAGSVQPLSGVASAAEIAFNPTGTILAVTEKSTNLIDTYTVNSQGVATGPTTTPSSGAEPFGFVFDSKGTLLVSEAPGSAASSYSVSSTGTVTTISGSVANGQAAACWLVATGNSRYAYTANAHNHTISSYTIGADGTLTLLNPVAANTGATDLDMAFTANSHFLYVFVHGSNSIEGFSVSHDGSLELVTTVTGVPATADGLAAF
jgi:6-phosphogluconolactonase